MLYSVHIESPEVQTSEFIDHDQAQSWGQKMACEVNALGDQQDEGDFCVVFQSGAYRSIDAPQVGLQRVALTSFRNELRLPPYRGLTRDPRQQMRLGRFGLYGFSDVDRGTGSEIASWYQLYDRLKPELGPQIDVRQPALTVRC